jgi:endonuclease/exonuclease/phosphatase family metal-dependent hydrolase
MTVDSELVASRVTRNCRFPIATLRVETNQGPVAILAVHAPAPGRSCGPDNERALEELRSWVSEGRLTAAIGAARAGDPVIVAGDLNALPFSRGVRGLHAAGLRDTWSECHARPVLTWAPWPWLPRLARIDYILVGGSIDIEESWVFDVPGSDHSLVMADVRAQAVN